MSREAIEALMDRWMNEPTFREAMRRDPEETVNSMGMGIDLDADEWAALRAINWNLPDEALHGRASKSGS